MKIIPLMFITIIILLSSFPATIYKVAGARGGGGGRGGGGLGAGLGLGAGIGAGLGMGGFGRGGGGTGFGKGGGSSSSSSSSAASAAAGKGGKAAGAAVGSDEGEEVEEEEENPGWDTRQEKPKTKVDPASASRPFDGPKPKVKEAGEPNTTPFVIPKKSPPPPKKTYPPLPQNCKPEVKECVNNHIHGDAGQPTRFGPCCAKFRISKSCGCNFLTSQDPKVSKAANGVLQGCHFKRPICIKTPIPQECKPEAKSCINTHILGGGGDPEGGSVCCDKFRNSVKCICKFLNSKDPKLSSAANGVIRGCRYKKPNCPKA